VSRVPGDGLVDQPGVRGHDAGSQGHVTFGYPAVFYLIGEFLVGVVVLGDHHQSGSIFVQPVDDARPDGAANPLNVGASGQQSIHQSLVGVPWTGVHRQTGRFIDDHYIAVLVYQGQGHPLRNYIGFPRRRDGKGDKISGANLLGRFGGATVEEHLAIDDQPMQLGTGQLGRLAGQKLVQPHLSHFDLELSTGIPNSPD
jgi:hypothetical protein